MENPQQVQQQGNQQQPKPIDARFQPSKSLRQHIVDRLAQQAGLLERAQQRIYDLQQLAQRGEMDAMDGPKGLGDEQISAEGVEQMMGRGRPLEIELPVRRGFGEPKPWMPTGGSSDVAHMAQAFAADNHRRNSWAARGGSMGVAHMAQAFAGGNMRNPYAALDDVGGSKRFRTDPRPRSARGLVDRPSMPTSAERQERQTREKKQMEKYDPVGRCQQLDGEIMALLVQRVMRHSVSVADTGNPYKEMEKMLKKVLGGGDGGDDSD
ncbi:hypothetical protein LTR36_005836 [Oleoguttula mirabilis]|uniref:Uncharacterized protein n=1 Tax=Oleoguttula mirabilis TaxID=1507867 RepID=A0AAV9JD25_9PEZI|nr:hypothetical protein LTR36_005836 [Oleoguttula mirabilis]